MPMRMGRRSLFAALDLVVLNASGVAGADRGGIKFADDRHLPIRAFDTLVARRRAEIDAALGTSTPLSVPAHQGRPLTAPVCDRRGSIWIFGPAPAPGGGCPARTAPTCAWPTWAASLAPGSTLPPAQALLD